MPQSPVGIARVTAEDVDEDGTDVRLTLGSEPGVRHGRDRDIAQGSSALPADGGVNHQLVSAVAGGMAGVPAR
jgi:hypothetical protein